VPSRFHRHSNKGTARSVRNDAAMDQCIYPIDHLARANFPPFASASCRPVAHNPDNLVVHPVQTRLSNLDRRVHHALHLLSSSARHLKIARCLVAQLVASKRLVGLMPQGEKIRVEARTARYRGAAHLLDKLLLPDSLHIKPSHLRRTKDLSSLIHTV